MQLDFLSPADAAVTKPVKPPKPKAASPKKEKKKAPVLTTAQRLAGIVKACRNHMRKDKGLNGDSDRLPMLTWLLFLKFLDDTDQVRQTEALLTGKKFSPTLEAPYRWRDWASDIKFSGDDLKSFINDQEATRPDSTKGPGLFAYLRGLKSESGEERRDVVREIFGDLSNNMREGSLLRDVVNELNKIHFDSSEEIYVLGQLYESILKEMRDAAGDAGEFYTPRAVVKFMVGRLDPRIGETVLDPASGTGGFLVEAFEHLKRQVEGSVARHQTLQATGIRGGEAKSLPFLLCQMNLLLHGLEFPRIAYGNSLGRKLSDIGPSEQVHVILANPPFGGEEERSILKNFPAEMQTAETAYLFLQLIMRRLRRAAKGQPGGRAAVVVPNNVLFDARPTPSRIKEQLLTEFNLHTVVRLPEGVFEPYTAIPANLLFFEHTGKPTKQVWFYELPPPTDRRKYSKTKPLTPEEFAPVVDWWTARAETEQAWAVPVGELLTTVTVGERTLPVVNLDRKNPHRREEAAHLPPAEALRRLLTVEERIQTILAELQTEFNA